MRRREKNRKRAYNKGYGKNAVASYVGVRDAGKNARTSY